MKRKMQGLSVLLTFFILKTTAQVSFTPVFPTADEPCTMTFNPKEGDMGLASWTGNIYAHTGVTTPAGPWQNVKAAWGTADPAIKLTRQTDGTYTLTYPTSIRAYYGIAAGTVISAVSFVFHNGTGNNSQSGRGLGGADIFYTDIIQANSPLRARIVTPSVSSQSVEANAPIAFRGAASQVSTLKLTDNGIQIATASNVKELTQTITAPNIGGSHRVVFTATANSISDSAIFTYIIVPTVTVVNPPAGVELGANVNAAGDSVTFLLQAPNKQNVFIIGSFNNYATDSKYLMNKSVDGTLWWLKIGGLTPNQTYTYQYLVDGSLRVADPLSTLILDPNNDRNIPSETYPNPLTYPSATTGYVSVITPGKAAYNWQVPTFQRPTKGNLVVYELLIRDFVAKHNYQTLIDTLNYLKNLGINAIELMPVTEFDNNESWGYNPTFHAALDKYYGTPDKFKQFIDVCHQNGIAVILDVVFNHIWGGSTLSTLYFAGGKPSVDNPWLNPDAKHPYNVGYDMNHESPLTKAYVERCLKFLLKEYKLDGFRFDLAKGFTQNANCGGSATDEACISRYDASRVAILKNYNNVIQATTPGAYTILELFAENSEETVYANEGMMVWGNTNFNYNEATMGYIGNNLSGVTGRSRGWTNPATNANALVGYMESHDEERLNYKNLNFGNVSGSYSVKDLNTALHRIELAEAFFYTVPGPKMLWQEGELGFDVSINDGGCRICNRPFRWQYFSNANRRRLYDVTRDLIYLRKTQAAFQTINYSESELTQGYAKAFHITDASLNATIIGNFNVVAMDVVPNFQHTGMWYDYLSGDSLNVTNVATTQALLPGDYRVYVDKKLAAPPSGYLKGRVGTQEFTELVNQFTVYPNPSVSGKAFVGYSLRKNSVVMWEVYNLAGQKLFGSALQQHQSGNYQDAINADLPSGIYMIRLSVDGVTAAEKLTIQK